MTLRGPMIKQLKVASKCRSKICVACGLSMAAYRASMGRFNLDPEQIRVTAGVTCDQNGIPYLNGITAVSKLTNGQVKLTLNNGTPTEMRDDIASGRLVVMSGQYSEILHTSATCEDDFTGGHAFALAEWRMYHGEGQYLKGDPLCDGRRPGYANGWEWVNAALMNRSGLARTGGHGINYVSTQDTERVRRTARLALPVYDKGSTSGKVLGHLKVGTPYFVQRTLGLVWAQIPWGQGIAFAEGRGFA